MSKLKLLSKLKQQNCCSLSSRRLSRSDASAVGALVARPALARVAPADPAAVGSRRSLRRTRSLVGVAPVRDASPAEGCARRLDAPHDSLHSHCRDAPPARLWRRRSPCRSPCDCWDVAPRHGPRRAPRHAHGHAHGRAPRRAHAHGDDAWSTRHEKSRHEKSRHGKSRHGKSRGGMTRGGMTRGRRSRGGKSRGGKRSGGRSRGGKSACEKSAYARPAPRLVTCAARRSTTTGDAALRRAWRRQQRRQQKRRPKTCDGAALLSHALSRRRSPVARTLPRSPAHPPALRRPSVAPGAHARHAVSSTRRGSPPWTGRRRR